MTSLDDLPGDACPACGEELPPSRHVNAVYCSQACGIRARNARRAARRAALRSGLTCPECGGAFDAPRTLWQVYCSRRCMHRAASRRWQATPAAKTSRAEAQARASAARSASAAAARAGRACPECGVVFDARTGKQVYCSPRCQWRSAERRRGPRRGR